MRISLTAVLGLFLFASVAHADTMACSGGAQHFTVPLDQPLVIACDGHQFDLGGLSSQAVLFWQQGSDRATLSDYIILTNTDLGSMIVFVSAQEGVALDPPANTPILAHLDEPDFFMMMNRPMGGEGPDLRFLFTSDHTTPCSYANVWISPIGGGAIPEPATLSLLGTGILGLVGARKRPLSQKS